MKANKDIYNKVPETDLVSKIEALQKRVSHLETLNVNRLATEAELAAEQQRLKTLYQLSSDQNIDLDMQIENTLRLGVKTLKMDVGIVSYIEGLTYTVLHFFNDPPTLKKGQQFKLGDSYCSITLEADDVVAINHMGTSPYTTHPCYAAFKLESYIGVPIIVDGKRFGTLNFSSPTPTETLFTPADKDFIRLMGRWVSNVLERQKQENQLKAYRLQLEQMLEQKSHDLDKSTKALHVEMEGSKKLQGQLQKAQRMEAIGTLAGGIAHDFNNILSAIFGYAQLTQFEVTQHSQALSYVNEILRAGKRARDLVQQILAFSRQSKSEKAPAEIGLVVREVLKLLRASIPPTIEIRHNIKPELPAVLANQTQIHQVIMNLCTNAWQAMKDSDGLMEVNMDPVEIQENQKNPEFEREPGKYIRITVSDTGGGIEPEIINRIFEPYFTTKDVYEGTGLGLAMVHGIIKEHGGSIRVYSEPGQGTKFSLLLPVIADEPGTLLKEVDSPVKKGNERILFVDDEDVLAYLGKQMLEKLGYRVTCKTDSLEALELFNDDPFQFDLVISDVIMPKLKGPKLAEKIHQIRPDIPIMLCSGFSPAIAASKESNPGIKGFIIKPLILNEMAEAIRNALDGEKID